MKKPFYRLLHVVSSIMLLTTISFHMSVAQNYSAAPMALEIGDTIPDINVSNFHHAPDSIVSLKSLYEQGGLIMSFWATWCSPCIDELKLLSKVKPEYEKLNVLSVTYENSPTVERFLERQPSIHAGNINILLEDTLLRKFFPHHGLPHVVWIDNNGVVRAITNSFDVTEENFQKLLTGRDLMFIEKKDRHFDFRKPMDIPDSLIRYRSLFHGYRPDIGSSGIFGHVSYSLKGPSRTRFYAWNLNATHIIWSAYNLGSIVNYYLVELHTKDSTHFFYPNDRDSLIFAQSKYAKMAGSPWPENWQVHDQNWMRARRIWANDHLFSYEFISSDTLSESTFFRKVISELEFNLDISTSIADRKRSCVAVTMNSQNIKRLSSLVTDIDRDFYSVFFKTINDSTFLIAKSATIEDILFKIHSFAFARKIGRKEPYVNDIDFPDRLDLKINFGKLTEWPTQAEIEEVLSEELGFQFNKATRFVPVLVINDLR